MNQNLLTDDAVREIARDAVARLAEPSRAKKMREGKMDDAPLIRVAILGAMALRDALLTAPEPVKGALENTLTPVQRKAAHDAGTALTDKLMQMLPGIFATVAEAGAMAAEKARDDEADRLRSALMTIYSSGTYAEDGTPWSELVQHSRSSGVEYGWNEAARIAALALGLEEPIGPNVNTEK